MLLFHNDLIQWLKRYKNYNLYLKFYISTQFRVHPLIKALCWTLG